MQVNTTGKVAWLELKNGETMKVFFCPRVGDSHHIIGAVISTLELPNGEIGLTVAVPTGRTFRPCNITLPFTLCITG